jgi:hypothetical protein
VVVELVALEDGGATTSSVRIAASLALLAVRAAGVRVCDLRCLTVAFALWFADGGLRGRQLHLLRDLLMSRRR